METRLLRGSPQLHAKVKGYAADHGITMTEALDQLLGIKEAPSAAKRKGLSAQQIADIVVVATEAARLDGLRQGMALSPLLAKRPLPSA